MDETSQIEVKTLPAGAAKEARPYHTASGHCKCSWLMIWLEICRFLPAARTTAQDGKNYESEHSDKNGNDQNLDGSQQKATERNDRTQQGYDDENKCGNTAERFK
jgi:hypothetical protein